MWYLVKTVIALFVLVTLGYCAFFVDLAGKPFSEHALDVWQSPVMQAKLDLLHRGVKNELEDKLSAAAKQQARKHAGLPDGETDIADVDRKKLNEMLAKH
jgi:hypothetical protein